MDDLHLPPDLHFGELALEQDLLTDRLLFAPSPLGQLCVHNGIDPEATLASEDKACELICAWYVAHREAGGKPDSVAEAILARLAREEAAARLPHRKGTH